MADEKRIVSNNIYEYVIRTCAVSDVRDFVILDLSTFIDLAVY